MSKNKRTLTLELVAQTNKFVGNMNQAGKSTTKFGSDVKSSQGMLGGFNSSLGKGVLSLAKFAAGFTPVAAVASVLKSSLQAATGFGKGMAEVSTLGVKDLDKLSKAVRQVAKSYGQDLTTATNAAYQAISAGVSEADTPKFLAEAAKAATAGVTELNTAVNLGAAVSNAFGKSMADVDKVFDQAFATVKSGVTTFEELQSGIGQLAPTFAAAGLSSQEMFASVGALTKAGIKTDQAMTSMRAAISNINKPTSEAKKLAKDLGISFNLATLQSMGLSNFLAMLAQKTGGSAEKMGQLFGSTEALGSILALTGNQAGDFNALLTEMNTKTGQTEEAFQNIVANDPSFAFNKLKAEVHDVSVSLGTAFMPAAQSTVSWLDQMIKGTRALTNDLGTLISKISEAVGLSSMLESEFGKIMKGTLHALMPGGAQEIISRNELKAMEEMVAKENKKILEASSSAPPLLGLAPVAPSGSEYTGASDLMDDILGKAPEKQINVTAPEMLQQQQMINEMVAQAENFEVEPVELFDTSNIKDAMGAADEMLSFENGITDQIEEQNKMRDSGAFISRKASTVASVGGVFGGVAKQSSPGVSGVTPAAGVVASADTSRANANQEVSLLQGILEAVRQTAINTRASGDNVAVLG